MPTRKAAIGVQRAHRQERHQLLVGFASLPRPLPFPFIDPPNLCMLTSAVQRFMSGIVSPTRPILYGIRYCLPRYPSPTPPQGTAPRGSLKFSGRVHTGPRRLPIQQGVSRCSGWVVVVVPMEGGGGGGRVGRMTLSAFWRRQYSTTARSIGKPTPGGSHGTISTSPRASVRWW